MHLLFLPPWSTFTNCALMRPVKLQFCQYLDGVLAHPKKTLETLPSPHLRPYSSKTAKDRGRFPPPRPQSYLALTFRVTYRSQRARLLYVKLTLTPDVCASSWKVCSPGVMPFTTCVAEFATASPLKWLSKLM